MFNILSIIKKNIPKLIKLLPLLSFVAAFLLLYYLYPTDFEKTWKGRTFYIFFLWLISLETILNWEKLQLNKISTIRSLRAIALVIALFSPTIYVVAANYWGLNNLIVNLSAQNSVYWASVMPLSIEYLVFTLLFIVMVLLEYGTSGLKDLSVSAFFLGTIGVIYTIDNIYPQGSFTPFQMIVPTTAMLAANVLNLMGYHTYWLEPIGGMPRFIAWDSLGRTSPPFAIAWPCSGVESLLIYAVTIALFLKGSVISWKLRVVYFVIGAVVTYFINVLRIATIYIISINGGDFMHFHDYYGSLYSITWIVSYPMIIIGSQILWNKIRSRKPNACSS